MNPFVELGLYVSMVALLVCACMEFRKTIYTKVTKLFTK